MTTNRIPIPHELITKLESHLKHTFGDAERLQKPQHLIQGLREEFTRLFLRPPNADDPLYFDPDQPKPVAKKLEVLLSEVIGVALDPDLLNYIETVIKAAPDAGQTVQ